MVEKQLVGISGSLRKNSANTGLLRAIQKLGPVNGYRLTIINYSSVPLYDQDIEDVGNPAFVNAIREIISDADGIIFACPEYNGYFSGALKNLIDWGTRKTNIWANKPSWIISAGGGGGGIRGCKHLDALLTDIKGRVMPDSHGIHVKIFNKPVKIDLQTGDVNDKDLIQELEQNVRKFVVWIS